MMTETNMAYRVLLFDLFGTIVHFTAQVPTLQFPGEAWRSTMQWLQPDAERELPEVPFELFSAAVLEVTAEIVRARPPDFIEVLSTERFRRVLLRLGLEPARAERIAPKLCLAHMDHLASRTEMPEPHRKLLEELAPTYALGLISNFDHAPTARGILSDAGVSGFFRTTLISAEFGRRKPHPAIFASALRQLGATTREALFIGDSVSDDVRGAQAAGIDVAWINRNGESLFEGPPPNFTLNDICDLPVILREASQPAGRAPSDRRN